MPVRPESSRPPPDYLARRRAARLAWLDSQLVDAGTQTEDQALCADGAEEEGKAVTDGLSQALVNGMADASMQSREQGLQVDGAPKKQGRWSWKKNMSVGGRVSLGFGNRKLKLGLKFHLEAGIGSTPNLELIPAMDSSVPPKPTPTSTSTSTPSLTSTSTSSLTSSSTLNSDTAPLISKSTKKTAK
ncbi:hypothetical protein BU26DRAFT_571011 [Trematosphaeria pertusa]|uniref:Uncharacterized protein n=1 Tax=Trematosphaeria pertusa TaxID=390896 RepID=A0A6A6HX81_9PLEO|nr:uncharacterized protein BU26DRAFT_571011 [Trematosphaeria pertusa]KAF2242332.1 hypothetical protein BU26DRAFT_571011 [Trematosphaeria pertusa]